MILQAITEWAGSVGSGLRDAESRGQTGDDTEERLRDESRSSLFRCSECQTVYIATDKTTCSSCDAGVEQVPSTLTETV